MKALYNHKGFSLIEMMVTVAILGVVMTAIYAVYISMNQTSSNEMDVVETQQNLRIALNYIGTDIRMSGCIIPADQVPVSAATASSLTLQTASSHYDYAMLSGDLVVPAGTIASDDIILNITMPAMVDRFSAGDNVRLIRPQSGEQPYDVDLTVTSTNRAVPSITLNGFANSSEVQYKAGDLLALIDIGAPDPTNVVWNLNGSNLQRTRDGGSAKVIAQNITALNFTYILTNNTTTTAPTAANLGNIKAVSVAITGTANSLHGAPRQRSLESTFYMRNRLL